MSTDVIAYTNKFWIGLMSLWYLGGWVMLPLYDKLVKKMQAANKYGKRAEELVNISQVFWVKFSFSYFGFN